jgi:hypothetical protein
VRRTHAIRRRLLCTSLTRETPRFFYTRALNCCKDIRVIVGCSADPYSTCTVDGTEYAGGECGALQDGALGVDGGLPDDYECQAFPAEGSYVHEILVALIAVACTLPVQLFLEYCFETSNEAEVEETWLTWSVQRSLLLGGNQWSYATQRPGYLKRAVAQHANEWDKLLFEIIIADAISCLFAAPGRALRWCFCRGAAAAAHGDGEAAARAAEPLTEAANTPARAPALVQHAAAAHAEPAEETTEAGELARASASSHDTVAEIHKAAEEMRETARKGVHLRAVRCSALALWHACSADASSAPPGWLARRLSLLGRLLLDHLCALLRLAVRIVSSATLTHAPMHDRRRTAC